MRPGTLKTARGDCHSETCPSLCANKRGFNKAARPAGAACDALDFHGGFHRRPPFHSGGLRPGAVDARRGRDSESRRGLFGALSPCGPRWGTRAVRAR